VSRGEKKGERAARDSSPISRSALGARGSFLDKRNELRRRGGGAEGEKTTLGRKTQKKRGGGEGNQEGRIQAFKMKNPFAPHSKRVKGGGRHGEKNGDGGRQGAGVCGRKVQVKKTKKKDFRTI